MNSDQLQLTADHSMGLPVQLREMLPGDSRPQIHSEALRVLLPAPKSPMEALEVFHYEVLLALDTVTTRNRHWAKFLAFLGVINMVLEIPLNPSILLRFTQFLENIQATKDYISTVVHRCLQLHLLAHDSLSVHMLELVRLQIARYTLMNPPQKALPVLEAMFNRITLGRLWLIALFWLNTGLRQSGILSIPAGQFPTQAASRLLVGPFVNFFTIQDKCYNHGHYCPTEVVVKIINSGINVFPVRQTDVDMLCRMMGNGVRSHSFRRAFAISVRCHLARNGFATEASIKGEKLKRINMFGWLESSETFFGYCADYIAYMNVAASISLTTLNFILNGA